MILSVGGAGFEAEVLRDRILELAPLLSYSTADTREGEDAVEGLEGEDSGERILGASRVTSAVAGPCITRWTRLTLRSNNGVS